jgi:hypothetical protein
MKCTMDCRKPRQERGITLDLGFSSFSTDAPEHIQVTSADQRTVRARPCLQGWVL